MLTHLTMLGGQEAAYNMGRAAHQLGLLHLAVPLYERALKCVPAPCRHVPWMWFTVCAL